MGGRGSSSWSASGETFNVNPGGGGGNGDDWQGIGLQFHLRSKKPLE